MLLQHLMDRRDVTSCDQMFEAICEHLKYATNDGVIRPTITVFRQRRYAEHDLRIWNDFVVGYAGYEVETESQQEGIGVKKIGDQGNLEFTKVHNIIMFLVPHKKRPIKVNFFTVLPETWMER